MNDTAKELSIIGAGGFGREVADAVREALIDYIENISASPHRDCPAVLFFADCDRDLRLALLQTLILPVSLFTIATDTTASPSCAGSEPHRHPSRTTAPRRRKSWRRPSRTSAAKRIFSF
jgi:hypothetical protein